MYKSIASLGVITGTITSVLMSTSPAVAAVFNWSYTTEGNDVYTGMLEGDIQGDGNTVEVTSVFMTQLNGSDLPETPIIRNSEGLLDSTGVVSLNGMMMDLGACTDTACDDGIFIGDLGLGASNFFSTTTNFGDNFDDFNAANWELTEKIDVAGVPEPSLTFALVGLGLSTLIKTSLKKD